MADKTQITEIEYKRPFMYPYQTALLNSTARFTICEASTKVGKTASHIVWLFEQALKLKENQRVWWVAPTVAQAKIAYSRMKAQVRPREIFTCNETDRRITLVTGGIIEFKTAEKPDNLYGDDVYAFVFDEFTRAREAAHVALISTVTSTGGPGKFIGNVTGTRNWGHRLAMKAKAGDLPNYEYHKITAYDAAEAGMKTKAGRPLIEEIEEAKLVLTESQFKALYLAEATEDGTNPFGLQFIAMCCMPEMSTNQSCCFGIDLARKVDWATIIGLDKHGSISHYNTFTKKSWPHVISIINELPNKPMAIDGTGVGDAVVPHINDPSQQVESLIITPQSKQMLIEQLAVAIQGRKIIIPDDGDVINGTGRIRHQLEQFEIQYTRTGAKYSAPEGEHADDVMALALAWHKWQTARLRGEAYNYSWV